MRIRLIFSILILTTILNGCTNSDDDFEFFECENQQFDIGFTSWSYGPTIDAVDETYKFIELNGTMYAEHIDNKIPWNAWMNGLPLPPEFTNEIEGKAARRIHGNKMLLSVSLLNGNRDDLAPDMDGSIPAYESFDDPAIVDAYFYHLSYMVDAFQPDYLLMAIEVNELRLRAEEKWEGYISMMAEIQTRIKGAYPSLQSSVSISLHNMSATDFDLIEAYQNDVFEHLETMDYAAISYYPFIQNDHTISEFNEALNVIHDNTNLPIALSETGHIAEDLIIPNLGVYIPGNPEEQNLYLQTLFSNAKRNNYLFVIWYAHRDYDALWETFPPEIIDIGQIWRDTGILDESGYSRPAKSTWNEILEEL